MLRVVLDVNVLVSSLVRRTSVPAAVVTSWRAGFFELLVSESLLAELRDVLGRPHLARYLDPDEAQRLLSALERSATLIDDPSDIERLVPGDPDDDYLVALARAGRAHVIVTGNRHLLATEEPPPALTPADFLAWLERLGL